MELFIVLLVFALIIGGSLIWQSSRSQDILSQWANENGYRLLETKSSPFKGPFFWTSSRSQTVYRVVVEDQTGNRRQGWVQCGSWWGGVMSDRTQVKWDD